MPKALITGGAGFLGGHLGRRLAEDGQEIHLLDNLARGRRDAFLRELLARPAVELLERDLARPDALDDLADDYTHVFHLAAIVGVRNVLAEPYATLCRNVDLLETALGFARRQQALERFVFFSTSEVYAGSLEHLDLPIPTPEDVPLALPDLGHPRTSYLLSKLYGEAMVRHAGVPFTILRPHNVYGPRMGLAHVIPELLEKAHRAPDGGRLEVFSVDHRRTFCFIDDAVEMVIRAAMAKAALGLTLNLGSPGPELTIGELAEVILRVVGRRLSIEAKPPAPGSPARRCPDTSRMTAVTGYRARVPLETGIERTYAWYRSAVFEGEASEVAR
jgi:nucleoside-diphosphate-sugar epimerase